MLSVQRQLAEANSKLASLTATCRSQQQQISQLQVLRPCQHPPQLPRLTTMGSSISGS